jgi:hypothetical protein
MSNVHVLAESRSTTSNQPTSEVVDSHVDHIQYIITITITNDNELLYMYMYISTAPIRTCMRPGRVYEEVVVDLRMHRVLEELV